MRRWAITIAVLICIVVAFLGIRITTDVPHIVAGTTPADDFAERYVAHPWIGYGHVLHRRTIRIRVGIFTGMRIGLLGFDDVAFPIKSTFGLAFWLGPGSHVLAGEWWLRRTPALQG